MTVIVFITDNDSPRLNWMVYDLYFNKPSAATSLIHLLDQSQPAVVVSWQTRNCGGDRDMTVYCTIFDSITQNVFVGCRSGPNDLYCFSNVSFIK